MLCERCSKKKATVFYRENINGKARAFRLCGECASALQETGELEELSSAFARFAPVFGPGDDRFFGELFSLPVPGRVGRPEATAPGSKKCPLCGATFGNIAAAGKVGCATCYQTFADELALPLRAAHGETVHVGQAPRQFRTRQERAARLAELRQQLKDAVIAENFEEAAALRDRIRGIDQT